YGAAKAGLDQMCLAMADTLDGTGVTLQIVRPGFVRSKMTAGLAEPPFTTGVGEVADAVVRGLESGDRVIYSPPVLRYVFTVLRVLPRRLWRLVADR
ncbi:short-chain dehydrogenase/reductase SDR, partial [mine drainage metagenome]